jgi:NADH:ubiquinone oxidoreductase subunit H
MWDLKLYIVDFFDFIDFIFQDLFFTLLFFIDFIFQDLFFTLLNSIDPFLQNGLLIFNSKIFYQFPQNMTFFFAIKFCAAISFLILIRGGAPRYRYDYLTKLGWLKFLGFVIVIFFSSTLTFFLF